MSKSRGFEKIALAVVCHNGDHDDSFAIVEEDYEKDIEVIVEEQHIIYNIKNVDSDDDFYGHFVDPDQTFFNQ